MKHIQLERFMPSLIDLGNSEYKVITKRLDVDLWEIRWKNIRKLVILEANLRDFLLSDEKI